MTTKSDELCRLLNIKPKRIYWGGSGDGVDIYPDLTKPSNFVKLLFFKFPNFDNEYYNILEFMTDNNCEIENIDEFVTALNSDLATTDKRILKDLQHQAQQTKWEH